MEKYFVGFFYDIVISLCSVMSFIRRADKETWDLLISVASKLLMGTDNTCSDVC